ncbi:nuclear pore complex assembly domain-containing protein [Hirsutella rhossiliensis]|uniref:Nuclear pore complex assembly domain-containing protein n=1 Tax=Hirsutella rhossiliensis TaxID=111463 RepID=A0A9P8MNJ6_9HYPO|nr:nuclear pore complex assembly domain-containing protein [Hirsutella rhossiliensis]KAH0958284.1 nuclear pore complex assembly domain-containing protein [Hirsutella rhossiliensis]
MLDYSKFDRVFPSGRQSPYDRALQHEIEDHRKGLEGTLFIDRVMKSLGISKGKPYPPKSDGALRQLHQQICEAAMSIHHKQSLLYYILLDFDAIGGQGSASQVFASESGMPTIYQTFMKGLWHMDRQDYQQALECVAHPSLSPDFADEIIIALVRHAPNDDYSLALSYFYTVRPILKSSSALEQLFDAMIRTNATEALLFSRSHPQHTREQLFRRWVWGTLEDGRGQGSPSGRGELAFMPLDSTEENWFEEYLTTGEGRNLKRAKDTLLIRKIACDRFADVGKQRAGGQWAAVLEGIKNGTQGHGD